MCDRLFVLKINIKIFFLGICIFLTGCLNPLMLTSTSVVASSSPSGSESNNIPFDQMYFLYSLKAKKNDLPIFDIDLSINYTRSNDISSGFNFHQKMVFKSFLLYFIGENQENATFIENTTTRNIQINNTEGSYIYWLIYHVSAYNSSIDANNWDPFWIFPAQADKTYPIYSFYFNLTQKTKLKSTDLNLFNYSRPVLIFNGKQTVFSESENITNNFGLIYDNYTGVLLKGVLDSTIEGINQTDHYYANFELKDTNAFSVFPPYPVPQLTPNYIFLIIIIALPILFTIFRLMRLKEISGGIE